VKVMKLADGERVVSIARAAEPEEAERDAEAERDPEADGDPGVGLSAVDEAETAAHLLDLEPALGENPAAGDDDGDPEGDEEAPTVRR
jgi:hypothetical protein